MSARKFIFSGLSGCSNHSCVVHGQRTGMGTNGACHCVQHATPTQLNILAQRLDHAINKYDDTIRQQQATIERLTEQLNVAAEENAKLVSDKYPFAHIRIDCSEYEKDLAIRNKLIELGWTPPAEIEAKG